MSTFRSHVWSSVGKKMITGLTGLMLVGFVAVHLLGNLTLFIPDRGHAFNAYAYFLEHAVHGWLILAFEAGLLAVFGFHIVAAVTVAWTDKRRARPVGYALVRNAGGKSRKGLPSTSMIVTGSTRGKCSARQLSLVQLRCQPPLASTVGLPQRAQ